MAILQRILTKDKIRDKKTRRIIKSSQERYKNVETGEIISRRQRDKLVREATKKFAKKYVSYTEVAKGERYNALLRDYQAKQRQYGNILTKRDVQVSNEFTQLLKDLEKGRLLKNQGKIAQGNKLIIRALEKTDRRDNIGHDTPPGESPQLYAA